MSSQTPKYRIESAGVLSSNLLHFVDFEHLYDSYSLAVAVAAKSVTKPVQKEVRVVRLPDGEVVFRTQIGTGRV